MDSKVYVPISATQAAPVPVQVYPQKRVLSVSTGSLPIRAPPTFDSGSGSDSESIGPKTSSTSSSSGIYNGFESDEGFLTGEEFESASERALVAETDEEILEEDEKAEVLRPFVADPDDEGLESYIEDEEERGEVVGDDGPLVEPVLADSPNLNRVMPKAQLSMDDDGDDDDDDDDDDDLGREVDEDGGFLGTVRVPDIEFLEKIGGASSIKALATDDDELVVWSDSLNTEQSESPMEGKVVEDDKVVKAHDGALGIGIKKALAAEEPGEDTLLAEVIQDMGPGAAEVADVESLITNGVSDVEKNARLDKDAKHSDEEKGTDWEGTELNATDGGQQDTVRQSEDGCVAMKSASESGLVAPAEETNEVMEETSITNDETDLGGLDTGESVHYNLSKGNGGITLLDKQSAAKNSFAQTTEPNLIESSFVIPEAEGSFGYVPKESTLSQSSELDVVGSSNLLEGSHSEKIENRLQPGIELGDGFHDATDSIQVESLSIGPEGSELADSNSTESLILYSDVACEQAAGDGKKDEANIDPDTVKLAEGNGGSPSDNDMQGLNLGGIEAAMGSIDELEQKVEGLPHHSQRVGEQIILDSDKVVGEDMDGERKQLFDSVPFEAFLKAVTGANSEEHSTCLDSSFHSPVPAPKVHHPSPMDGDEFEDGLSKEEKKKVEKIELLRVKFLRLLRRLGIATEDFRDSKVLNRFVLDARRYSSQTFSIESHAKRLAMQLEAEVKDNLDFFLNILVLGKTGVGKTATINSILGEEKEIVGAFKPTTTTVKAIVGTIDGIKIRFLDTPGFRSSATEQSFNWKVLASIKKVLRKFPPDIVLYVDRLDTTQNRDLIDFPLFKSITSSLGPSIWLNAVITLTHAASALPDGQSGSPLGFEELVCEQSNVIQKCINEAVGDLQLMNPTRMCPVSLVENHPLCQKNSYGEKVLPNGLLWRPHLLLMFYSIKILSEATPLLMPQTETAMGANSAECLNEEDFTLGENQSTISLSPVKARVDTSLMPGLQAQFSIGRSSKMAIHVGLNDEQSGQITVRTSSSDQLHIALFGILPIAVSIFGSIYSGFRVKN